MTENQKKIRNDKEINLTDVEIEYKGKYIIMRDNYLHNKAIIVTVKIIDTIKSLIHMPEINSQQALQQVKSNAWLNSTNIVIEIKR